MMQLNNYLTFKDNKNKEKIQGVYAIEVNNKIVYVGQSVDVVGRCKQHSHKIIKPIEECKKYKSDFRPLYSELRELFYNDYYIKFLILERVKNKNKLKQREKYYMDKYNPPLNKYSW